MPSRARCSWRTESYSLAFAGGLLQHQQVLRDAVLRRLAEQRAAPRANMVVDDPAHGAVLLASDLLGRCHAGQDRVPRETLSSDRVRRLRARQLHAVLRRRPKIFSNFRDGLDHLFCDCQV